MRLMLAIALGLLAAVATYGNMHRYPPGEADDFTYYWYGARALAAGENPYVVIGPTGTTYHRRGVYAYPLPAAVVVLPLVGLPAKVAASIAVGAAFALATYGLLGLATWRLLTLLGFSAIWTTITGHWGTLLLGAALVPTFGGLLAVKPTIGVALFLWRPSWRAFWGGIALCTIGLVLLPTWPLDWLETVRTNPEGAVYRSPLLMPGGALLSLALLRWRLPEARLLLAMALAPQTGLFYDQLPLLLVARRWRGLVFLVLASHLGRMLIYERVSLGPGTTIVDLSRAYEPAMIAALYLPCLVLLLRESNEGPAPAWLERWLARAPRWLRGRPAPSEHGSRAA